MPAGEGAALERRSILIVEDESIVALDLQETLNGMGYDAYAIASSADEAIAYVSERCPDLILMDIRIKGDRDGIQTAELLRDQFLVPAIFLTAHADDATIARAKRTTPYGYLLKPVRAAELRSAIEVALYRHEIDKRLRERERWFSTTLRSIGDAVITVDLGGKVTFMNQAAERLTGQSLSQALGRPASDVVKLDGVQGTPLDRALSERAAIHVPEAGLTDANEQRRIIADSAAPVMDAGELLGAVMVFRDVTEQRQLQQQLELSDRLASLGTMAAGVAHEVNNPLAVIVGNASQAHSELSALKQRALSGAASAAELEELFDEMEQAYGEIQAASQRIERIVSDLRMFSRPSNEASGEADVARALDWARRATTPALNGRAQLVLDVVEVDLLAAVDELRLGQVLVNLVTNAAQAMPSEALAGQCRVEVRAYSHDERIIIEVRDNGAGVPEAIRERIFEPFFTTKPRGVGTGLGLSICHGIIKRANGELLLECPESGGSIFRIVLPAAPPRLTPSTLPPDRSPITTRARVLIIDDEPAMLRVLARMTRVHATTIAPSAQAALDLLADGERFDVVLCDLAMAQLTGIDFYERLLVDHPDLARRVIFVSGGMEGTRARDFRRSVSNIFLDKPFPQAILHEHISRLLGSLRPSAP
jgi:two-component system, cell cycle sensor histidine kinase and response regulator CckA